MSLIFLVKRWVFRVLHSFNCLYFSDLTISKKFANDPSLIKILDICEKTGKKVPFYGCKYSHFSQMSQIISWFFSFAKKILVFTHNNSQGVRGTEGAYSPSDFLQDFLRYWVQKEEMWKWWYKKISLVFNRKIGKKN